MLKAAGMFRPTTGYCKSWCIAALPRESYRRRGKLQGLLQDSSVSHLKHKKEKVEKNLKYQNNF